MLQDLFHAGVLYTLATAFFVFATIFLGWVLWDIRKILKRGSEWKRRM